MRVGVGSYAENEAPDIEASFRMISAALALIEKHTPKRFVRVHADVARIWVGPLPTHVKGMYQDDGTCALQLDWVVDPVTPAVEIAGAIVHEAMHARLDKLGFEMNEANVARIERACWRAELAFARRVPGAEHRVSELDSIIGSQQLYASDAELQEGTAEAVEQVLIAGGFRPSSVRWITKWLRRGTRSGRSE